MRMLGKALMTAVVVLTALGVIAPRPASALAWGIFGNGTSGVALTAAETKVEAQGHTADVLANLGSLGYDVLWILNGDNGGYGAEIGAHLADLAAFVSGGGVLSFHDRAVDGAGGILPGAAGATFTRSLSSSIDVEATAPALITNGPGGVINDGTLDGGNFSNHGFTVDGTLAGMVPVLNNGNPGSIVDMYYSLGAGAVYYSTIPMDFYLSGSGSLPAAANFRDIYAPNEIAFQASLFRGHVVPEPATMSLLGLGLAALAGAVRRRRA